MEKMAKKPGKSTLEYPIIDHMSIDNSFNEYTFHFPFPMVHFRHFSRAITVKCTLNLFHLLNDCNTNKTNEFFLDGLC